MNIRELLKIEVWSKRTTRKVVVVAIVVIGAARLGLYGWQYLDRNWLTPGERSAASEALARIDKLREPRSLDENQFSEEKRKAKSQIDCAERKAWTIRDQGVAFELKMYLMKIVSDRQLATQNSPNQVAMRETVQKLAPELMSEELGPSLHQELDQ